jgi:hypothetical protein
MRKLLAKDEGQRKQFTATFSRFGKKVNYKGYSEPTVLLINITDPANNSIIADHAWFGLTKGFENLKLKEGIRVEFEARIKEYKKGYVNKKYGMNDRRKDFKLSHPTKIKIIS